METAVVCSGRTGPSHLEGPVGSNGQAPAFVGSSHEPEQQLASGVVQGLRTRPGRE